MTGACDAPALLFVHGGQANRFWWDAIWSQLPDRYRIIVLDLSGHGFSGWRPAYSFEGWLSEVTRVLGQAAPRGATVIGHSLGGALALSVAARGTPGVQAVLAVDAAPGGPARQKANTSSEQTAKSRRCSLSERKPSWLSWLAERIERRTREIGRHPSADPAIRGVASPKLELDTSWTVPVKILLAEQSDLTPSIGQMSRWLRASHGHMLKVHQVQGAGHDIVTEQPWAVTGHIVEFENAAREVADP